MVVFVKQWPEGPEGSLRKVWLKGFEVDVALHLARGRGWLRGPGAGRDGRLMGEREV